MKSPKRLLTKTLSVAVLLLFAFLLVFHPSRPLWIKHESFTVMAPDGIYLEGTLSLPRWQKPVGAVVLVHGSGPLSREHVRADVRSLVALGFAVAHYDKRGVGQSGGQYMPSASTPMVQIIDVLAADAGTVMEFIQSRFIDDEIDCGFFGASQAGWIVPMAASRSPRRPSFNIILSGTPVSTGMEAFYSGLTGDGAGTAQIEDMDEIRRLTLAFDGEPGFDPMPVWKTLHCPTLWLLGLADVSVPSFASVRLLEEYIQNGHAEHQVVSYANMGHDLRDIDSGKPADVWQAIRHWYRNRTKR